MKKYINKTAIVLALIILIVTASCYRSILQTGATSEENRIKLANISKGMSQRKVQEVMGYPFKIETKKYRKKRYDIWYYVTKPVELGQSQFVFENYTPLIFRICKLIGWGKRFYRYFFDIDDIREKIQGEKRQKYTNDKEEWPRNEHIFVTPMHEPQKAIKTDKEDDRPKTNDRKSLNINSLNKKRQKQTEKEEKKAFNGDKDMKLDDPLKKQDHAKKDQQKLLKEEIKDNKEETSKEHPNCKGRKKGDSWQGHENKYSFWE